MKRALSILGQMVVLFLAAFAGMLFLARLVPSLHVVHIVSQQGFLRRQYEFDWLISVSFVYTVFLLIGLAAKRIRTSWMASTVAFVLTVLAIAVFTRIGFKEINLLYGNN